jgi:hypothetical protein
MGKNKKFVIVLVAVVVLLVGAVVFFVAPTTPSGQTDSAGEISSGGATLGVPPQVSNGEELAVTESSNAGEGRNGEMLVEAISITETDDFVLTISAEKTTASQGEDYRVHIELKNTSGEEQVIHNDIRFISPPALTLGLIYDQASTTRIGQRVFEIDSTIQRTHSFRNTLELGTHELQFIAEFSLRDSETGEWERINILSNPITLTSTDDFVLTVSVEGTTLRQGERFRVIAELKNNSGEDREIDYELYLFMPQIEGWWPFGNIEISAEPVQKLFEAGSVLREESDWPIRYDLEPGTHELIVRANIWFLGDRQETSFSSAPIILTVE